MYIVTQDAISAVFVLFGLVLLTLWLCLITAMKVCFIKDKLDVLIEFLNDDEAECTCDDEYGQTTECSEN